MILILVLASSDNVCILLLGKFPYLLLILFGMLVSGMLLIFVIVVVTVSKMLVILCLYCKRPIRKYILPIFPIAKY